MLSQHCNHNAVTALWLWMWSYQKFWYVADCCQPVNASHSLSFMLIKMMNLSLRGRGHNNKIGALWLAGGDSLQTDGRKIRQTDGHRMTVHAALMHSVTCACVWTSSQFLPRDECIGCFNNIMSVLGYGRDEMLAVFLAKTYCLPMLLYGCETWHMSSSEKHKLDVAWNNCFRKFFNACWRESAKPLLFYCGTMPVSLLVDQRIMIFL